MDQTILDLLRRSATIPTMPEAAARFLEIIQDPDFEYRDIVDVLSTDPGMTAEILRLANSPLFGVTRQITSLAQALTLLGLKRVRSLVLGRYIVDSIDKRRPSMIDMSYYWRRSLTTAVLASRLCEAVEPKLREEAFTAGLLADIGIVLLDETLPDLFRPVAQEYRPHGLADLSDVERKALTVTHGHVSAIVLEDWCLPEVVCKAVSCHSDSCTEDETQGTRLAQILRAAERVGKYLCESLEDTDEAVRSCVKAIEEIHIEPAMLGRILGELEPQITEFASVLRINVVHSETCGAIAQKIAEVSTLCAR